MEKIYINRRGVLLHAVSVILLLLSVFISWYILSESAYFIQAAHSKFLGISLIVLLLILGNSMTIAMLWLNNRYVLKIFMEDNQKNIKVITWNFFGKYKSYTTLTVALKKATYFSGRYDNAVGVSVNSPWLKIVVPNKKSLVLDLKGDILNKNYFPKRGY